MVIFFKNKKINDMETLKTLVFGIVNAHPFITTAIIVIVGIAVMAKLIKWALSVLDKIYQAGLEDGKKSITRTSTEALYVVIKKHMLTGNEQRLTKPLPLETASEKKEFFQRESLGGNHFELRLAN